MSLEKYIVKSDKFEAEDDQQGFAFPCNVCVHRHLEQVADPCASCGHNLMAEIDE